MDIKDYNLEYYIFTNPDIIIERADITAKATTLIFNSYINHCIKTFNNSFLTDCQILGAFKHNIEYNYASLNITTFLQAVSLKHEIDYFYNGHADNLDDNVTVKNLTDLFNFHLLWGGRFFRSILSH